VEAKVELQALSEVHKGKAKLTL